MDQLFAYLSVAALAVTGLFSLFDLAPLIFALEVVCGYFLVVFLVLRFIPSATSQEIGKSN